MAGSFTVDHVHRPPIRIWSLRWTSYTNGKVNGTTVNVGSGQIVRIDFVPGLDDEQPTDEYDVRLIQTFDDEEQELDVLYGAGMNRSDDTVQSIVPTPDTTQGAFLDGEDLELKVDNAGSQNTGILRIVVA